MKIKKFLCHNYENMHNNFSVEIKKTCKFSYHIEKNKQYKCCNYER